MRKIRLFGIIALLAMCVTLFASCGSDTVSFDTVFNSTYDFSAKSILGTENITELNGYSLENGNKYFAVFEKENEEDDKTNYKVFSFKSGKVVASFSESATYAYDIDLCDDVFFVCGTEIIEGDSEKEPACKSTLYDDLGNQIVSYNKSVDAPEKLGNFYVFNYVVYEKNANGVFSARTDIVEFLMLEDIEWFNDEYFCSETSSDGIIIYDKSFKPTAYWNPPTYAENVRIYPLNSGNVFVQYSKKLADDADTYDYYETTEESTGKYDLVTVLVYADGSDAEEIEFEYLIGGITARYYLSKNTRYYNYFTEDFENIAIIYPIVDGLVDASEETADYVLMDNDGVIEGSLKIVDGQISMPDFIYTDMYKVNLVQGGAIVNADGEIIQYINNDDIDLMGRYFVTSRAIYTLSMEKVYDINDTTTVIGDVDNAIFVKEENGSSTSIIEIYGKNKKTIATGDKVDNFSLKTDMGLYEIYDDTTEEYRYYTISGELIISLPSEASVAFQSYLYDDVIVSYTDTETNEERYVIFKK